MYELLHMKNLFWGTLQKSLAIHFEPRHVDSMHMIEMLVPKFLNVSLWPLDPVVIRSYQNQFSASWRLCLACFMINKDKNRNNEGIGGWNIGCTSIFKCNEHNHLQP